MADTNHNIYLTLNLPGYDDDKFREAVRAIRFTCEEEINRPYTLKIMFYIPGNVKPEDDSVFLEQAVVLHVENHTSNQDYDNGAMKDQKRASAAEGKYSDASQRTFHGRITECENLGIFNSGDDEYHFYQILVQPNFHNTRFSSPIRTYVRPLDENSTLTYKDVLKKALGKYNDNLDQEYYIQELTDGSVSTNDRFPVEADFDGISLNDNEDATILKPKYAIQYRESYYNFILRILERQGWYYYFDFEQPKEKLDGQKKEPQDLEYIPETMRFKSRQTIERLGVKTTQFIDFAKRTDSGLGIISKFEKRTAPVTQVSVLGYNPDSPKDAKAAVYPKSDPSGNPNAVVVPDNFFELETEGQKLAQLRYEEFKARERKFRIKANLPGAAPGQTFVLRSEASVNEETITEDFSEVWAVDNDRTMKYFIVAARHRGTSGAIEPFVMEILKDGDLTGEPTVPGYLVDMDCVPNTGMFRPQKSLPWSDQKGTVLASTLPIDTETGEYVAALKGSMYFVSFKGSCTAVTDLGDKATEPLKSNEDGSVGPLRLQSTMTVGDYGVSTYLNVGSEVLVSFQEGDPDRPLLLGPIPNADNIKTVFTNAIEATVESCMAAYLAQDPDTGDGSFGVRMTDKEILQLAQQNAMTYANLSATFNSTNSVAMNAFSGALNNSMANMFNGLGAAGGFGIPSILTVLSELNKMLTKSNSLDSLLNDTESWWGETASMVLSKMPGVSGMLMMLMALGQMDTQSHRVSVMALPEVANVNLRSQAISVSSKIASILTYALKLVNDTLSYVTSVEQRQKVNEDAKEQLGQGFYKDNSYHAGAASMDGLSLLIDAFVVIKLLWASCTPAMANNGVMIKAASGGGTNALKGLALQAKSFLGGVKFKKINPNFKYSETDGMDVDIQADRSIKAAANTSITLDVHKDAANIPPTANNDSNPKAIIALNIHHNSTNSNEPNIYMDSTYTTVQGEKRLGLFSDEHIAASIVTSGTTLQAGMALKKNGHINMFSQKSTHIKSNRAAEISTSGWIHLQSKAQYLNLTGSDGEFLVAHYNDGKVIAGKPYIAMGGKISSELSLANAAKQLDDAVDEYDAALVKYNKAVQDYREANSTCLDKHNQFNSTIMDNTASSTEKLATLTTLSTTWEAAKLSLTAEETAVMTALTTLNQKDAAIETAHQKYANIQLSPVTKHSIALANGQNAAEYVLIDDNMVTIASDKEILLDSKAKVNIKADSSTKIELDKSGSKINLKGTKVTVNGSNIQIG